MNPKIGTQTVNSRAQNSGENGAENSGAAQKTQSGNPKFVPAPESQFLL
jgi:hypothetical protein